MRHWKVGVPLQLRRFIFKGPRSALASTPHRVRNRFRLTHEKPVSYNPHFITVPRVNTLLLFELNLGFRNTGFICIRYDLTANLGANFVSVASSGSEEARAIYAKPRLERYFPFTQVFLYGPEDLRCVGNILHAS